MVTLLELSGQQTAGARHAGLRQSLEELRRRHDLGPTEVLERKQMAPILRDKEAGL